MTTENHEIPVVTELPSAKKHRFHNPLAKKSESTTDTNETPKKVLSGVQTVGLLLVGAGVVAAVTSKLGKKVADEASEIESDTSTTD